MEVCINNAWGTVCNARFGTNEARVICRQLTFDDTGIKTKLASALCCMLLCFSIAVAIVFRSAAGMFGQASGPIFLENLACSGAEQGLLDCPRSELGTHQCDHSRDSGVQCFGMIYLGSVLQYSI